jgi:flagellar L-ring protein FlgH
VATHTAQGGSLWSPGATLADLARDPRASQVDDVITVLVADRANAVASGGTKAARKSSAKYSVASIFGPTRATGALSNLANASGQYDLDGQGTTSRDISLTTTLTARVTKVLPNGYLLIEGIKQIAVNSESQTVTVRGVVRPLDVTPDNAIPSDRIAQMDVRVNGKGVVGDAVKRPFFLYRLLLGLLPL